LASPGIKRIDFAVIISGFKAFKHSNLFIGVVVTHQKHQNWLNIAFKNHTMQNRTGAEPEDITVGLDSYALELA